jgi:uncharacterized protein (DUF1800 family)
MTPVANPPNPTTAPALVRSGAALAAVAAHRFGLGEPSLAPFASDPLGWLQPQPGAAPAQRGAALASADVGLRQFIAFQRSRREMATSAASDAMPDARSGEQMFGEHFRAIVQADVRARLVTAATTAQPFNERLALFWANHFTVSMAKASVRGLVGAFEREAVRPQLGGSFAELLAATTTHAAMLRYLDNDNSAGPDSALVQRIARRSRPEGAPGPRISGLNENLAREVLELHTLGVAGGGSAYGGWGGYTQADVTAFAAVLTGWRVPLAALAPAMAPPGAAAATAGMAGMAASGPAMADGTPGAGPAAASPVRFDPAWHQPGPKTVLGRRYPEGPDALGMVLADLARHPSTASFLSYKLARHFVADEPPPALVVRLARTYLDSDGHLPTLALALAAAPEAWSAAPSKLKTPEEFVISTVRLLGLGETAFARQPDGGIAAMGQRVQSAPSPAGWPDRAEDWLGPDALWKRVEWATRVADRVGRQMDARALAAASLGERLSPDTARQIERAADGPQALALLLMAPEFQRR